MKSPMKAMKVAKKPDEGPDAKAVGREKVLACIARNPGPPGLDEMSFRVGAGYKDKEKNVHSRAYHRSFEQSKKLGLLQPVCARNGQAAAAIVVEFYFH